MKRASMASAAEAARFPKLIASGKIVPLCFALFLLYLFAPASALHAASCWPAWNTTTAYNGGSQVSYSGQNYQSAYWTQGNNPSTSSGPAGSGQPWIPEGSCSGSGGATPTPTASGCTPTTITPYIQVNGGSWQQISSVSVSSGSTVTFGPQPVTGGSWSWSGPNGYSSTSRQISVTISSSSTYTATYSNASGCKSTQAFTVTVGSTPPPTPTPTVSGCTPTSITPYIQVNGGSWQQTASATVSAGSSVNLGPQPVTGGSWSWSGPNGYSSTSRQIAVTVNATSTYTATYTNASGCKSTQVFTLTVNGAPPPTPTPTVSGCSPTSITPYIQVNGGSWQQTSSTSVSSGSSVTFGPQPATGGSWSWSGPNGYSSTSRQISVTISSNSTYTSTYTNTCGSKSTQAFNVTVTSSGCGSNCGGGNGHVMVGYWHDWETPEFIPLANVPSSYDIIVVAFANYSGGGTFTFTVDPDESQSQFIADIKTLHSQGKKVLISCGGASETPSFSSSSDASNFANSISGLMNQYGFDGVDIDFENGGIYLNPNDLDINNPTTPSVVYTIQALQNLHSMQPNAMITIAPIPNYAQAAYQYYGPGQFGASNWNGAQLPVINNTRNILSYVWPQYYNEANIKALDGNLYSEGSEDNLVAMSELLLAGFPVANNAGTFAPLSQKQVVLGVPACASASPGNMSNAQLEAAFNYLAFGGSPVGSYTLRNSSGYPNVSGYMTWSINWDVYCQNGGMASGIKQYLNSLP